MSHPLPEIARQHAAHKAVRARLMAGKYHADEVISRINKPSGRPPGRPRKEFRPHGKITALEIIAAVASAHGLSIVEMGEPNRSAKRVEARAHAVHLLKELRPEISYITLGHLLARDHASMIHARKIIWPRIADRWKDKVSLG